MSFINTLMAVKFSSLELLYIMVWVMICHSFGWLYKSVTRKQVTNASLQFTFIVLMLTLIKWNLQ